MSASIITSRSPHIITACRFARTEVGARLTARTVEESAAERAIDIGARTYGSVKSILDNNLDRRPARKRATDRTPILHSNIRGSRYYN